MALRNYTNNAPPQALLTPGLAASSYPNVSTAYVGSTTGYPTAPFIVGLERGTNNQEVCLCTGTTGTTLTLIRGYNGTPAPLHNIGATLEHTSAAIDYSEPNAFINLYGGDLGDIVVRGVSVDPNTGTYATVLAVGSNGQSLTANSGATNGMDWEQIIAPGIVAATAGSSAPAGWVLCNGASYLRGSTPYSDPYYNLFVALGAGSSPWGLPDGTHFKVPDLRGRTILGVGTGAGLTARVLATDYGAETHTQVAAEIAQHTHTMNFTSQNENASHSHAQAAQTAVTYGSVYTLQYNPGGLEQVLFSSIFSTGNESASHGHQIIGTTDNYPGSAATAFGLLQPSTGLNYIVKL
jgi:microcystin-dependent protein